MEFYLNPLPLEVSFIVFDSGGVRDSFSSFELNHYCNLISQLTILHTRCMPIYF